jgi:hypothetical protein
MKTALLALLAYATIALIGFGSLIKPIALATIWSDRLGAPLWPALVAGSMALAASAIAIPSKWAVYRAPVFVTLFMATTLLSVGLYADRLRKTEILRFGANRVLDHSFFQSVHESPKEFQFFLHAAALKNCVPYAWSYREMKFYRLPLGVAINVLPDAWLNACPDIARHAIT